MGWDPFDGLNSKAFKAVPLISSSRFMRLAFIQLFKRSPINLRRIFLVPKGYNSKGLGLFLAGYCKEYKFSPTEAGKEKIDHLVKLLLEQQSTEYSGSCWGYNFDWQARAFFQPKNTPTVVASVFIASALLDAYEITNDESLLTTARSTCDFILKDLHRTYDGNGNFSFSYSPLDKSVVFNAGLLGSRLLARVYSFTHEKELIEAAKKSVAYSCNHQKSDGSWGYGILPYHQWVDSFHTGYNLECISDYMKFSGDNSFKANISSGFEYYINNFFTDEGIPKYYNTSIYPIDVHSPAQLVITLAKLDESINHKPLLDKVLLWTIDNMQSPKGYFYYQANKFFTSKIPYIRWSQAWMFYALTTYIFEKPNSKDNQV
jgi:hypothetical protein